ncbi:MAG: GAF domain-containing protein [Armatimonadota bacterium]
MSSKDPRKDAESELTARINELEARLRDKELEADALRQVGQAMGILFDIKEMLKRVCHVIVQVTGTDLCMIYLLNKARSELVLRAASGPASGAIGKISVKVGEGVTGWVAKERKPVVLDREAWRDARFKPIPEFQPDSYQSMLSVPLMGAGNLVGVITVSTDPPHEYTPTQIGLLMSIADQVGGAIENFSQYQKMKRRASHLTTLSEISRSITSDMYLEEVLHLIVAMTAEALNLKICSVVLLDEERQELVIKATQASSRAYRTRANVKLGESPTGEAVAEGRPVIISDVRKDKTYPQREFAEKEGLCSLIAIPLKVKGKAIGALNCYTAKPHVFTDEEITLLTALASHAAMAIQNSKLMVRSAIIQEMHHRVKNSLQTIASLLRLQLRYGNFESVEQVLKEIINRILAIASVHELLSGDNLDNVSIRRMAEAILSAAATSMLTPDRKIDIRIEGEDITLSAKKATPVALILNELLQNAIDHGFKDNKVGKIILNTAVGEFDIKISVKNDGEPLPEGFDLRANQGMGLQIVETLVHNDLAGKLKLTSGEFTEALVTFPK